MTGQQFSDPILQVTDQIDEVSEGNTSHTYIGPAALKNSQIESNTKNYSED